MNPISAIQRRWRRRDDLDRAIFRAGAIIAFLVLMSL
jgi:hypothetical protein